MTVTTPVYMDNQSTTRVDPRVVEAMSPYWSETYGNAGSTSHPFGWDARDAVDMARERIAKVVNGAPKEIVFTSGATESNNLALRGLADRRRRPGDHIVSVATEHKAILDPLAKLGRDGFEINLLSVETHDADNAGWLDPQKVREAIRDDTLLVSVMLANNEIGVVHPIRDIAAVCRDRGVPLHCDATQAIGKLPVDVDDLDVDLMSFSAHKAYGPKGVGALYVRRRGRPTRLLAQMLGGGQEHGLRSGTLNVPGIVGFGACVELAESEREAEQARVRELRDGLFAQLQASISGVSLNGPSLTPPTLRLAGNLNCRFAGVDGEALMMSMRELAVSSGSACTSANPEPSHVLREIGVTDDDARSSLRFGLGRFNRADEVEFAVDLLSRTIQKLRSLA